MFALIGRTKPDFQESCDVNYILKKYLKTGVITAVSSPGQYGDFSEPFDFMQAQNRIVDANQRFEALPSDVRKRFNNDPGEFLDFASDEKNHDEMVKLGLLPKPAPKSVEPTNVGEAESSPETPPAPPDSAK